MVEKDVALVRHSSVALEITELELKAILEMSSAGVQSGFLPEHIKTVAQAKAIAFMGHALGVHPAMAWNHSYQIKGRVGFDVKLQLGVVQAKVPTLDLEVVELDDKRCVIEIQRSPKHRRHTIEYTMERARRENRTRNPLYESNPEDMLYKQAVARGLHRVAAAELMGFPPPPEDLVLEAERGPEPRREPSSAEAVDEGSRGGGHTEEEPEVGERLVALMKQLGWRTKAARLQAAGTIMSEITGTPVSYKATDPIAPSDVQAIYDYLARKYPDGQRGSGESRTGAEAKSPSPQDSQRAGRPGAGRPAPDPLSPDDDAPPPDPGRAMVAEREAQVSGGDWDAFLGLVERARKVLKRPVLTAGLHDKTKTYLVDQEILHERGHIGSLLLWHAGAVVVEPEELSALALLLRARCDKEEREGGRNV